MEYKGYLIEADNTFGYKEIKPLGRGSIPKDLRGKYTSSVFATKAIDLYLENKGVKDGGTKATS